MLVCLFASPLQAETVAKAFFEQCVGPAFERQLRAQHSLLACHADQSCSTYDPLEFSATVDRQCFLTAIDVCVVFDNADACVTELVGLLATRNQALRDAFPENRVRDAIAQAQGFAKVRLERNLDAEQPGHTPPCFDERVRALFRAAEVSESTLCDVFAVSQQNYRAHAIQRDTVAIEAAVEQ